MKIFFKNKGIYLGIVGILEKIILMLIYLFTLLDFTNYSNTITPGAFTKYISVITGILTRIENVSVDVIQIRQMTSYLRPFLEFLDILETKDTDKKSLCQEKIYEIRFDSVSYKYPDTNTWVLKDISFVIKHNENISVVGENGSGKTTLIKLICGLLEPTEGHIYVNGKDTRSYSFTKEISTVFQDPFLFNYSIKKNITLSDGNITDFENYIKKWNLWSLVSKLPLGYDTVMGKEYDSNGIELSGGQFQKICFARAGFKNASLYILDEPTSSYDVYAERFFLDKVHEISEFGIIIVVSHNFLTVNDSDRVIFIRNSELCGNESHKNLLVTNNYYRKYYETFIKQWSES